MYTIQLLSDKTIHIDPINTTKRHGPIGIVIFVCNKESALQIQRENN